MVTCRTIFFPAGITTWPWTLTEPWWQTRRPTRQQTTSQTIMQQRWGQIYFPTNVNLFLYSCSNVNIKTIPEGKHYKRGFTCKINYFTVANVGHHAPRQSYEWRCHRFQMKTISFSKSPDNTLESVHFVPHDVRTDGKVLNKYTMVKIVFFSQAPLATKSSSSFPPQPSLPLFWGALFSCIKTVYL